MNTKIYLRNIHHAVAEVANTFGAHLRTLYRWLERYAEGVAQALHSRPKPGRPSSLTAEQLAVPDQLWTIARIRELLSCRCGVQLGKSAVHELVRSLGLTPQRPLYEAREQDPAAVEAWEREHYPEIRRQARKAGARIYFADEAGLRSDHHAGTTWAPVGQTPVLRDTGRRLRVNMLSAVDPRGSMRFKVHTGTVNARVFIAFLQRLMHDAEAPVFVIVDGHPAHRAKKVQRFVALTEGRLRLFFLPPYAPHLNPDEAVWAHVKREAGKQAPGGTGEMLALARSVLHRIQRMPRLVRSFFHQSECQYILANKTGNT